MRRLCLPLILLLLTGPALAAQDEADELRRLQSALGLINQQLQSDYALMRSINEMRLSLSIPPIAPPSADPVEFAAEAERKRTNVKRDAELNERIDRLLSRTRGLEAQRDQLMERVLELSTRRPAAK